MGVTAYIVVKTSAPREMKTYLENVKAIEEAHLVYGGYDLVVKVAARSVEELGKIVLEEIRGRFPVEDTITLIVAD